MIRKLVGDENLGWGVVWGIPVDDVLVYGVNVNFEQFWIGYMMIDNIQCMVDEIFLLGWDFCSGENFI